MMDVVFMALGVFGLLGLGAWLEQKGKSKDEDYDDE